MKRFALSLALSLLLAGLVPGIGSAKIVVGLSSVNVAFLPVYVTEAKGFFKDEASMCCSYCSMRARPICKR